MVEAFKRQDLVFRAQRLILPDDGALFDEIDQSRFRYEFRAGRPSISRTFLFLVTSAGVVPLRSSHFVNSPIRT